MSLRVPEQPLTRWAWRGTPPNQAPARSRDLSWIFRAPSGTGKRLTHGLMILGAGLLVSAAALAKDYALREVAGWTVAASRDGSGCFLTRSYDGPGTTTLLLGLDADGSNRLSLLNTNWSIKPKDRERLDFRLSNASFPKHLAVGIASDGKKGFVTSFGEGFPAVFAASTFLHVFRGDVPVEQLSLRGSSAAVAELRRCTAVSRDRRPSNARGRAVQIPIDPFAPAAELERRR